MSVHRFRWFSLHVQIFIGLVLGAICGILANVFGKWLEERVSQLLGTPIVLVQPLLANVMEPIGQIFLRMLIMTVVPLVFASLAVGVAKLGDLSKLGRVGARTFGYFVITMTVAVVIGLALVNTIQPGRWLSPETKKALSDSYAEKGSVQKADFGVQTFVNIVPRNPLDAAVKMDMLGVIFFALLVGIGLTIIDPERSRAVLVVLEGLGDLMVVIINFAMRLAPIGVFALIFATTAKFGLDLLGQLAIYVVIVLVGLALQMFGVLSILLVLLSRLNPLTFFLKVSNVIVTAFSTSSSNATLPTSIKTAEEELGIPSPIAGFVLPLGATMNMNGTALFEGVTVVFLAQVFREQPLTLGEQAIVVVLSVLTAIGAAGVPGGSLPLLAMVLVQVGIKPEALFIILGVDRLLDMSRTTLNVVGDLAAATYVARAEGYELLKPATVQAVPVPPPETAMPPAAPPPETAIQQRSEES